MRFGLCIWLNLLFLVPLSAQTTYNLTFDDSSNYSLEVIDQDPGHYPKAIYTIYPFTFRVHESGAAGPFGLDVQGRIFMGNKGRHLYSSHFTFMPIDSRFLELNKEERTPNTLMIHWDHTYSWFFNTKRITKLKRIVLVHRGKSGFFTGTSRHLEEHRARLPMPMDLRWSLRLGFMAYQQCAPSPARAERIAYLNPGLSSSAVNTYLLATRTATLSLGLAHSITAHFHYTSESYGETKALFWAETYIDFFWSPWMSVYGKVYPPTGSADLPPASHQWMQASKTDWEILPLGLRIGGYARYARQFSKQGHGNTFGYELALLPGLKRFPYMHVLLYHGFSFAGKKKMQ